MAKIRDRQRPDRSLRPVQDIVGRIRFDPALDPRRFSVGYEERFAGIREAPLADFVGEGEIPWHRIWYVKAGALVVWDRRERIDLVFGSGDSPTADLAAIVRACAPEPAPPSPPPAKRHAGAEFVAAPAFRFDAARGEWLAYTDAPAPELRVDALQVLTYNVLFDLYEAEHIYSERRRAACRELLRAQGADILALQEVTPTFWAELLAEPWVRADYHVSAGPDAAGLRPYGQALLSRWPLTLEVHTFSSQKRLLLGRLELAGRPLSVAAVHLTSDHKADSREKRGEQLAVLAARLAREPGDALVLGDFNFGDGDENERLVTAGLEDAWPRVHPHHPGFTFDPVANPLATLMSRSGNAGRYDRILLRAPTRALTPVEVVMFGERPFADGLYTSDHFGVCALLQVGEAAARSAAPATIAAAPVHRSALVVIPPKRLWPQIEAIRAAHDPSHARWMPHINLVYGFVPEAEFAAAAALITDALRGQPPLRVRLATLRRFDHRGSTTVWLEPECEPAGALQALQRRLAARFPACAEQDARAAGYTPHLTIARLDGSEAEIAGKLAAWQAAWRPLTLEIAAVHLISRRDDEPFEIRHTLTFTASTHDTTPDTSPLATQASHATSAPDASTRDTAAEPTSAQPDAADALGVVALPPWAELPSPRHVEVVAAVARACTLALGSDEPCLHVIGSARLGVATPDSDLDLVCAGPAGHPRDDFFLAVREQLAAQGLLTGAREVGGVALPVLRFHAAGLAVDLQYAALPGAYAGNRLAELDAAALAQLDEPSRRAALGCLDADAVIAHVRASIELPVFRAALQRVRAWARARQLDVGAWGLLGGFTWALLVARAAIDASTTGPVRDPDALLRRFFAQYAAWDSGRPVALGETPDAPATRRAPWPIYTPTPPAFNSARSLTRSTLALLQAELRRARAIVDGGSDEPLCAPISAPHGRRVVVTVQAADPEARLACAGWLDGQVLGLLLALERAGAQVRPYPRPLVDADMLHFAIGVEGGSGAALLAAARQCTDGYADWLYRPPGSTLRATLVSDR